MGDVGALSHVANPARGPGDRAHGCLAGAGSRTLAGLRLSDRLSLDALTRLFPQAKTVNVQRAIAGILIRADYHALAVAEIARTLRQYRLKSPDGEDLIDVLIRRLQAS